MKNWYNCIYRKNVFLQSVVEKRISELVLSISEEISEEIEEIDRILFQKLEDIVADALIKANNSPGDLYTIFKGIETAFLEILVKPFDKLDKNDEQVELKANMMATFVRDSGFHVLQHAYQGLYLEKLPLPSDVDKRLNIRRKNIKKTGRAGIDPQGMELF